MIKSSFKAGYTAFVAASLIALVIAGRADAQAFTSSTFDGSTTTFTANGTYGIGEVNPSDLRLSGTEFNTTPVVGTQVLDPTVTFYSNVSDITTVQYTFGDSNNTNQYTTPGTATGLKSTTIASGIYSYTFATTHTDIVNGDDLLALYGANDVNADWLEVPSGDVSGIAVPLSFDGTNTDPEAASAAVALAATISGTVTPTTPEPASFIAPTIGVLGLCLLLGFARRKSDSIDL